MKFCKTVAIVEKIWQSFDMKMKNNEENIVNQ